MPTFGRLVVAIALRHVVLAFLLRVKLQKKATVRWIVQLLPHRLHPRQCFHQIPVHPSLALGVVRLGEHGLLMQKPFAVHGLGIGPQLLGVAPVIADSTEATTEFGIEHPRVVAWHGDGRLVELPCRLPRRQRIGRVWSRCSRANTEDDLYTQRDKSRARNCSGSTLTAKNTIM